MKTAASPLPPWQIVGQLAATPVSRTFKVAAGGQLAVLRIDEPGARHLGLDRRSEPAVLRAAAAADVGPPLIDADPGRGLLLTGWLPGAALTAAALRTPAILERAAALLRRLHATPASAAPIDLGAAIERYAALAGAPVAGLARDARRHLAVSLAGGAGPPCLCHGDPTPGNFIASPDGTLRLIDWEYAGVNHPEFDLAGLSVGAALSADQVRDMLRAYRGRAPTAAELDRQQAWEALCGALAGLWQAALAALPVKAVD